MTLERLHPADLAELADLVAAKLADRLLSAGASPAQSADMVSADEIARRFGVSAEWVRDHRDELGVVKLGTGPRPRLRFDPEIVRSVLSRRSEGVRSQTPETQAETGDRRRPRSHLVGSAVDSLPVRRLTPVRTTEKRPGSASTPPGHATRTDPSPREQRNAAAPASARGHSSSRNRKESR